MLDDGALRARGPAPALLLAWKVARTLVEAGTDEPCLAPPADVKVVIEPEA